MASESEIKSPRPDKSSLEAKSATRAKAETDIFVLDSVFPEAEAVFTKRPKTLDEVKDSALFALDANTLLLPYLTGSQTLSVIKKTYQKLLDEKRLLIPARAAREFAKNRVRKIGEIHHALTDKRSRQQFISQDNYPLLEEFEEYKQLQMLEDAAKEALRKYREAFGDVIKRVESWEWDDPISRLYAELFSRDIVAHPAMSNVDLEKAHAFRCLHRIPPGYQDKSKHDDGVGDFLIWQAILDAGKTYGRSVILVTGEQKPDWWHNSNKQQLYPRYELVDEFRRESGGHSFHIINFSRLLEMFDASENVVEEVRVEECRQDRFFSSKSVSPRAQAVESAVMNWFNFAGYSVEGIPPDTGCDFLINNGMKGYAVIVKRFGTVNSEKRLRECLRRLRNSGRSKILLVAVVSSEERAEEFEFLVLKMAPKVPIVIGIHKDDQPFEMYLNTYV